MKRYVKSGRSFDIKFKPKGKFDNWRTYVETVFGGEFEPGDNHEILLDEEDDDIEEHLNVNPKTAPCYWVYIGFVQHPFIKARDEYYEPYSAPSGDMRFAKLDQDMLDQYGCETPLEECLEMLDDIHYTL